MRKSNNGLTRTIIDLCRVQTEKSILTKEEALLDFTRNTGGVGRAEGSRLVAAILAVEVAVALPAGGNALSRCASELDVATARFQGI